MDDFILQSAIVNKNINIAELNTFDLNTGEVASMFDSGITKTYISFYMIFSSLYNAVEPLFKWIGIHYLPPYVLNMWVANLVFYFFSGGLILDIIGRFKMRNIFLIIPIIIWIGFYTGSIYYNVTLPHIVVTYLILFMSYLLIVLDAYFNNFDKHVLTGVFFLLYAMAGFGGTGAFFLIVSAFSIVCVSLLKRSDAAFVQIPLFLIPVIQSIIILRPTAHIGYITLSSYVAILFLSLIILRRKKLKEWIYDHTKKILIFTWMILFMISIVFIEDYFVKVTGFFSPQFSYDRTQDYFSFVNTNMILRNLFYYALIIVLIISRRTKSLGLFIVITIFFFINPFMKPWVSETFSRYDVYNRIFFTIINNTSLGIGLYALFEMGKKYASKYIHVLFSLLILAMLIPAYTQITSYHYPTYQPQMDDFNPLFKLGDSQIDILESVRQIVEIEELENPRLVSQILGTAMYAPDFVTLGYNVNQQRYGPIIIGEELYEIFYTPAIPGDHRPVVDLDLRNTCQLLVDRQVDFVVIDKSFSVFDVAVGDYLTIYWYIERCGATFVHENEDYIAFRFFRW